MKIAIVRGGFEGVRRQHSIWRLEQEVADAERILLERATYTKVARSRLLNLQNELARLGSSKEFMRTPEPATDTPASACDTVSVARIVAQHEP